MVVVLPEIAVRTPRAWMIYGIFIDGNNHGYSRACKSSAGQPVGAHGVAFLKCLKEGNHARYFVPLG